MTASRLDLETHSGDPRLAKLGNKISDAVYAALRAGLEPDFVCSVLIGVAADYWMQTYTRPCTSLADILVAKEAQRATRSGEP